jgi:hypothetical protein|tara:strand:- start:243 stop:452 length:210 start_codon:yes stop_codon:yes gene_type:complete
VIRQEILEALKKRYQAQVAEGFAVINIYLQNPVGIGEHPQHLDEIDKLLGKIKEAEEKMSLINEGKWML